MFVDGKLVLVVVSSKWHDWFGHDCVDQEYLLLGIADKALPPKTFAHLDSRGRASLLEADFSVALPEPFGQFLLPKLPCVSKATRFDAAAGNQAVLDLATRSFYKHLNVFQQLLLVLDYQAKLPKHYAYECWLNDLKLGFKREIGVDDKEAVLLKRSLEAIEGRKRRVRDNAAKLGVIFD